MTMKRIKSFLQKNRGQLLIALLAVVSVLINPLAGMLFVGAVQLPTRGRLIQVKRGTSPGTLIAGVRTKSLTINGEGIDITNDDSLGWRKLLDQPAEVSVEITVAGILTDEVLATEAVSTTDRVQYTRFEWPGATAGRLDGDFYLSSFSTTGEYQGSATFEATFQSTGAVAFTAAL